MLTTLCIATFVLVAVTLLPLWRNPHWLIRGMDFPRLQFAASAVLLLIAQLVFLGTGETIARVLAGLTLLCLIWQALWIAPYTRLWRFEVQPANDISLDRRLSILTANVLTTNRNAEALIRLVRQYEPDVLVTLESDEWWQKQLDTLQADMPHSIKCPLGNLYGMHVYSRLPLDEKEIVYLVEEDVPSMHALVKLRTGNTVRMHFLHPAPPSPTENPASAERDAELVIVARSVAKDNQPLVVTGDLNDVAWSATTRLFRRLSGLLDPRVGRGMFNTYHADYLFVRWPLDHLFHSKHFTVASIRRLPSIGSDHYPLFTELAYTPAQGGTQSGLDADKADHVWSRSIASKQDADPVDVPRPGDQHGK